ITDCFPGRLEKTDWDQVRTKRRSKALDYPAKEQPFIAFRNESGGSLSAPPAGANSWPKAPRRVKSLLCDFLSSFWLPREVPFWSATRGLCPAPSAAFASAFCR